MLMEGVFAAITTPFYADERVYYRKIEANVDRYSRSLLAGIIVLGSTGEAPAVNDEESREILRVAAAACAPEKVLVAGIGRESVKASVEMAEMAAGFKYDVALVRPPSFFAGQLSTAAILHYFKSIADRSPLPVVLYNIPQCVPYAIPIEVIAELAWHPNIIGIKDSSGKLDRIGATVAATRNAPKRTVAVTQIFEAATGRMLTPQAESGNSFVSVGDLAGGGAAVATAPPAIPLKTRTKEVGFQVMTGAAAIFLDALKAGASGGIFGFSCFAPQAAYEIYFAWKERDSQLAEDKQEHVLAANQRIVNELGVPGMKYACDFNGYYGGRPRAPLLGLTAAERAEVEQLLAEMRN